MHKSKRQRSRSPEILVPMMPSTRPAIALPAGRSTLALAPMTIARIPQARETSTISIPGSYRKKENRIAGTQNDTETMPRTMDAIAVRIVALFISNPSFQYKTGRSPFNRQSDNRHPVP